MRDSSQTSATQSARQPLLVVGGILALVVAAIGSVRAADDTSGSHDDSHRAADAGAGGGVGQRADPPAGGSVADDSDWSEGSLEPVRTGPAEVRDPVGLDDRTRFGIGLTARVVDVEAVRGRARGPGEIAGPALRVTVRARNVSSSRIPLDNTLVDMSYGSRRTPGVMLTGPGAKPFPASIAAGESATGRYVFNIPPRHRDRVRVSLTYSAEVPTAVFAGRVR